MWQTTALLLLILLNCPVSAQRRAISEGLPASGSAILITTNPAAVGIGTGTITAGNMFQVGGGSLVVTTNGYISHDGKAPTVSACGTATVYSTSTGHVGGINISAGAPTACTLTFVDQWPTPPVCIPIQRDGATTWRMSSHSRTSVSWAFNAGLSGDLNYWCFAPLP